MEVKINKEIRDYTESVYFGLSLRQFIFSILACGMAVVLYFVFRPYFGIETLSWLCILGAAPFAAIGFIKYNGMNAEEFLLAYIRSEFLTPKELVFNPTNYYYELLKGRIGDEKKDEKEIYSNRIKKNLYHQKECKIVFQLKLYIKMEYLRQVKISLVNVLDLLILTMQSHLGQIRKQCF